VIEIIKFIVWAIKKMSRADKIIYLTLLWMGICLVNLFIIGMKAILIFLCGFVIIGLLYCILSLYNAISDSWKRYKFERETEAQLIVERLRGRA